MALGAVVANMAGSIVSDLISSKLKGSSTVKVSSIDEIKKIVSIGSERGDAGVHIAALPCPKVDDTGISLAWKAVDIAAQAAALAATVESYRAAKAQSDIARIYYNLAKQQWEFYEKNYIPLELQEIAEINKVKRYLPDYDTAVKGHDCADTIFDSMGDHRNKLYNQYCVCPDPSQAFQFELALSTVRGDSHNFARRYAEFHADRLDDLRWNKKLQVATRGRGLLPQSSEFANKASGLFGQYSQAMSGFAGQAAQFSGYIQNRRPTEYNGWHAQRIETRLTERASTQTGFTVHRDTSFLPNYRSGSYYTDLGTQGGFYSNATSSLGSSGVHTDLPYGFNADSFTGVSTPQF